MLNSFMLKHELQYQIRQQETVDTITTNEWIETLGLDAAAFSSTHVQLLQAQHKAHELLIYHSELLTAEQRVTLEDFQQLMRNKRARSKLKPTAAYPIFNIDSKINRKLFKQFRQLTQE